MKIYDVIIRPLTTEKSSNMQAAGQYVFHVAKDATKIDIKNAVKTIYGADVKEVRTMIQPRKTRLIKRGKEWEKRPIMKKAVVTLKGKKSIDPNKITKDTKKK